MKNNLFYVLLLNCLLFLSSCSHIDPLVNSLNAKFKSTDTPSVDAQKHIVITVSRLNMRECPSTKCKIQTVLTKGSTYPVVDTSRKWVKVQYTYDLAGWISSKYTKPVSSLPSRERVRNSRPEPEIKEAFMTISSPEQEPESVQENNVQLDEYSHDQDYTNTDTEEELLVDEIESEEAFQRTNGSQIVEESASEDEPSNSDDLDKSEESEIVDEFM